MKNHLDHPQVIFLDNAGQQEFIKSEGLSIFLKYCMYKNIQMLKFS